jgi:hypothetical protein
MAINKNHEFEDLGGVKCAVVERNVVEPRLSFLKGLLAYNKYTVVIVPTVAKSAPAAEGEAQTTDAPLSYTVGVTDVAFNVTNAIFGRLLKTTTGAVLTLSYWKQGKNAADDALPYFASADSWT